MNNISIVVADSSSTSRKMICDLLIKKGFKIYEATDGAGAIRLSRSIYPDLVLIDVNIWGIKAYEVAQIIEDDGLSTVIFITSSLDSSFYDQLNKMKIFAYIPKPITASQFYQIVEFSLMNSNKINSLKKRVEKLENKLESRKVIDRVKGLLIEKFGITENEAYKMLRKKSMDECIPMEKAAEKIIENS